jgi:hypothetical protein
MQPAPHNHAAQYGERLLRPTRAAHFLKGLVFNLRLRRGPKIYTPEAEGPVRQYWLRKRVRR